MNNQNTSKGWRKILHVLGISLSTFCIVVFIIDPFSALKPRQFRTVEFIDKGTEPFDEFAGGTMISIKTKSGQTERIHFMSDDLKDMHPGSTVFIMSADVYIKGPDEQKVTFWRVFKAHPLWFGSVYPLWLIFSIIRKRIKRHNNIGIVE